MSLSNTTDTGEGSYACVRFYVSTISFSVLLFFNLIINWTIVREKKLRRHARFVLVFHLLVSALVYLGTSSIFNYQIHLSARPSRSECMAMITVLISSASNIMLTLTAMALDRFCAVCHPMRYTSTCTAGFWPWLLGVFTWMVALLIPLSLFFFQPDHEYNNKCSRDQLKKGELQKVLFIGVCTLLILYSYVRILVESRRLGVLNRRNRAGCRTIALHGTQLAVYILPNFVNFLLTILFNTKSIQKETKELAAVVIFAAFSVAQCIAPVVYGLRKEELLEQLNHRFPCCSRYLKSVLGWTVRASWSHIPPSSRERSLTAQTILSLETPLGDKEEEETGPLSVSPFSQSSQGSTDKT
uniref:Olfactory receptor 11A1-like n=3 Tax=Nothobranchius TaxID=28779 RepID=A0A1A8ENM6_9TELE